MFISHIGGALGVIAGGRIFDITGSYQLAFIVAMLLSLVGLLLVLFLRPLRDEYSKSQV